MSNLLILSNLALALLDRQAAIQAVVGKAKAEGRDVTSEELGQLFSADDIAREEFRQEIERAKDKARADRSGGSI